MNARSIDEERWASMPLIEQMANIGSEVGRAGKWLKKGNSQLSEGAFERALDLIDATIKTGRMNKDSRKSLLYELCRARELFAESFLTGDFDNLDYLDRYFGQFALATMGCL